LPWQLLTEISMFRYKKTEIRLQIKLKVVVHFKKKLLLIICLSFFSRKEIKVFNENTPELSPYNGLKWKPNGSRSK